MAKRRGVNLLQFGTWLALLLALAGSLRRTWKGDPDRAIADLCINC